MSTIEKAKIGVGVGVLILKNNKILLGKRHHDPKKVNSSLHGEGTWTMPGGKLEFKENFEDTAARELFEETSMKAKSLKFISIANDKVEDAHFVTIGMLCDDFEGLPLVMEPDKITEWKWFNLNDLPKPMFFPSSRILENYLEKRVYKKHTCFAQL